MKNEKCQAKVFVAGNFCLEMKNEPVGFLLSYFVNSFTYQSAKLEFFLGKLFMLSLNS